MSHSAAMRLARASSFFFSPLLKRQFSSSTTLPGSTSTPSSQSRTSGTSTPSRPDRCRATGASDSDSLNSPSFGRPKCEASITRAPAPSAWRMPASAARMRVSSVILPSLAGTLKSTRISTRLPRRSRSVIFRIAMSSSLHDLGPAVARAWPKHKGTSKNCHSEAVPQGDFLRGAGPKNLLLAPYEKQIPRYARNDNFLEVPEIYFAFMNATAVSSMRLLNPHSLSYQADAFTSVPFDTLVSVASKMLECGLWLKSTDTSGSVL